MSSRAVMTATSINPEIATPACVDSPKVGDVIDEMVAVALDRGDHRAALQALMSAYGDRIHAYCLRVVGDSALADDVHQNVFIQAYEGLSRYRRESSIVSWLLAIANHRCLDALKAARRRSRRFRSDDDAPEARAEAPEPIDGIDSTRVAAALEAGLSQLAPRVRMAVLLHYHEGVSFREMGGILGEKPATLQARVARAMPRLRAYLVSKGVTP